jgi:hypothetical protein
VGYYDLLWYLSRTFCGIFPQSRERKTGMDPGGAPRSFRRDDLPGETPDRQFPYIAYENPVAQIGQSSRATVETLMGYLTFGGGLAACTNERLLVLVPRAAGYDLSERISRMVHVYNPGSLEERTAVSVRHLPERLYEIIVNGKHVAREVGMEDLEEIPVVVPPRRTVIIEVVPSRQPSTYF